MKNRLISLILVFAISFTVLSLTSCNKDKGGNDYQGDLNVDVDGDGNPDINVDNNNDGKPDINIDTDGDGIPDKNVNDDGIQLPIVPLD